MCCQLLFYMPNIVLYFRNVSFYYTNPCRCEVAAFMNIFMNKNNLFVRMNFPQVKAEHIQHFGSLIRLL